MRRGTSNRLGLGVRRSRLRLAHLLIASVRGSRSRAVRVGWTVCCLRRGTSGVIRIACWSRCSRNRFRLVQVCGCGFNELGSRTRTGSVVWGRLSVRCGSDRFRGFPAGGLRLTRILIIFFRLWRLGKSFLWHVAFFAGGSANPHIPFCPADDFHRLAALQFQRYVKTVQRVVYPNAIFIRAALYW